MDGMMPIQPCDHPGAEGVPNLKETMRSDTPSLWRLYCQDTIRHRTLTRLQDLFREYRHHPSKLMWSALSDIAGTIEAMADGTCLPKFYLSSLDPGVGKTQTVIQSIKTMTGDPTYREVGVVVFLSRLDEIRSLVEQADLRPEQYSVRTSDEELNALGLGASQSDDAQVLFTTQRRLEQELITAGRFGLCRVFHYLGKPRQVRIWDESLVPGRAVTVDRDKIGELFPLLRLPFPELTDEIEALFWELGKLSHHASYDVPDFVSRHNVGQDEVIGLLPTATDTRAEVIRSLWFVAGRKVTVRKDMRRKLFIDYQDILPDDLAPLLILDASGRVRTTYDFWESRRQGLVRLRASDKRYDNLRVYVWERSGSKGSWRKNAKVLLEGLAAMVNSRPEENWLIVYHKKETIWIDIPKKLPALFHGNPGRLKFLQWGNHCATNAYKDIANVVLAGTLFYPKAAIEALGRAAAAQPASKGAFSQDDCNKVELGEHRHNVLQALCRAAVRRCEGGGCPPCSAFVIASKNSGIPGALPEIFPGAAVEDWRPCKRELVGKTKEAFDFIVASLKARPAEAVTAASVRKALGGYDKTNFRKIRKSPAFVETLSDLGIFEVRRGREQAFAYSPTV